MDATEIKIKIGDIVDVRDINVKDGKLTNAKISPSANIDGSKIADGSIPDTKLESGGSKFAFLKGKNVLFFGDSITDPAIEHPSKWAESFCSLTGAIEYNRGLSGSPVAGANGGTSGLCMRLMYYNVGTDARGTTVNWGYDNTHPGRGLNGWPQTLDMIIIYGGQNDWGLNKTIGNPTDAMALSEQSVTYSGQTRYFNLPNTLCGCLKYMFQWLRNMYPTTPIFYLGMHHVNPVDGAFTNSNNWREFTNWNYTTLSGDYQTKTNGGNSVTMETFRQAISNVCKMFGVPVIDLFDMQMSALLQADKTTYFSDGLHINSDGGKIMAKYVANKICEYTNNALRGL